jgi:hypothetical protein
MATFNMYPICPSPDLIWIKCGLRNSALGLREDLTLNKRCYCSAYQTDMTPSGTNAPPFR